jgi:hypothetical protein
LFKPLKINLLLRLMLLESLKKNFPKAFIIKPSNHTPKKQLNSGLNNTKLKEFKLIQMLNKKLN